MAVAAVLIGACGSSDRTLVGNPAPTFELASVERDGPRISLASLRGTPVVLNFWASWCAPCKKEMPAFERVHQRVGDDVAFLGVNGNDSRRLALRLIEETGVSYPSVYDPDDTLYRRYKLVGRPVTVLIGADGEVVASRAGELDEDELIALLEQHFPETVLAAES